MSVLRPLSLLLLSMFLTDTAFGDIRPPIKPTPKPAPNQHAAPVKIVHAPVHSNNPNVIAKLVIPRNLLPEMKTTATAPPPQSTPSGGTIIAGLALSAAAMSLIFFFQKTRRLRTVGACLIGCALLGGGYGLLLADVPVPGQPRSNPRAVNPGPGQSQIEIIIQENGTEVILTLPPQKS